MVNYYFLLLLLIIVFTNLYIKYKNTSREYFFNKKKGKKKRKNKLEELINNTNKYTRKNILFKKLKNYNTSQLKKYLDFLKSQESKYETIILKENLAKKISNNQTYIQNLVSNIIGKHMDWKYL